MYVSRQRYTVIWPYTVCGRNTKTKISRTRVHTGTLTDFFFGMYQLETRLARKIEHARTIFCVKLSINNHIVGLVHKNHTYYTNASDVPRSLQS